MKAHRCDLALFLTQIYRMFCNVAYKSYEPYGFVLTTEEINSYRFGVMTERFLYGLKTSFLCWGLHEYIFTRRPFHEAGQSFKPLGLTHLTTIHF